MPAALRTAVVLVVLLGLGLRAVGAFQPWDGADWHSALGGFGTGAYARNFADHGFLESRLMPYRWRVELADGTVERFWYPHHPALYSLLSGAAVRAFGAHTWALHLPGLCFSLLSLWACGRLALLLGTKRDALLSVSFFALLPMGIYYGILPWAEVPIAWLHMEQCAAYVVWWRTRSRRSLLVLLSCTALGGLLDWPANFLLPGLCLHLLCTAWQRREPRRLKLIGWLFVAALLPIVLHWAHGTLVQPLVHRSDTANTLDWVTTLTIPVTRWLAFQGQFLVRCFTLTVLALCALALGQQLLGTVRGKRGFENGLLLVLLTPALWYVGLFPARSTNHEFFWYLGLPWVALSCGRLCSAAIERARGAVLRWALAAATAVCLASCAWRGLELWRSKDTTTFSTWVATPWIQTLLDDRRHVVVAGPPRGMLLHFFSRAELVSGIASIDELERLREEILSRTDPARAVYYLFDTTVLSDASPAIRELFVPFREFLAREGRLVESDPKPPVSFELFDLSAWSHGSR